MGKANRVVKTFLADGSWTAPAGVTSIRARCVEVLDPELWTTADAAHMLGISSSEVSATGGNGFAWGFNSSGELGTNDVTPRSSPTLVVGGLTFTQMSGGNSHSLGLATTGFVYSWGSNSHGELGVGTVTAISSPVLVAGIGGIGAFRAVAVAVGLLSSFGISPQGDAYGWGLNLNGRLGDGTVTARSSPTLVVGGYKFRKLSPSGDQSTYGLTPDGDVYAWGGNPNGQLGDGTVVSKSSPVLVIGGIKFTDVMAGNDHVLGLASDGSVYAWGDNGNGQLGTGDTTPRSSPVLVVGGLKAVSIAAGSDFSFLVTTSGDMYAWGANSGGQLGLNNVTSKSSPELVVGGYKWFKAMGNQGNGYGLSLAGDLYGWGSNTHGETGDGASLATSSPVLVVGGTRFQAADRLLTNEVIVDVVPGTTYSVTVQQLFAAFGMQPLGAPSQRYVELEYFT